jgi:hypothetical protein
VIGRSAVGVGLGALLAVACGAPAPASVAEGALTLDEPAAVSIRYAVTLEPSIAEDGVLAVDLLARVTRGAYAPELTIGECTGRERICVRAVPVVPDCAGERAAWGCMDPDSGVVSIVADFHPELRASIVVHELLHTLGLRHGDGSVMTPDRPLVDFYWTCVSAETAAVLKARTGIAEAVPACLRGEP